MANELSLLVRLGLLDQLTHPLNRSTQAVSVLSEKIMKLKQLGEASQASGRNLGLLGIGLLAPVKASVSAFTELENAQVHLKNAMSTVSGLDENWAKMNKLAIEAGNLYPGTTADFLNLAAGMKRMGMESKTMVEGAFKGASALQVMFKLPFEEGGRQYAQMSTAMGIAGKDALAFADVIQRVSIGAGLGLSEIKDAMSYASTGLKTLGMQGLDNAKTVTTMMGVLKQAGVEGAMIGTTFAGAISHLATMGPRLAAGRGPILKGAREALDKAGIKLDFFDEKGQFKGMQNFITQFDKLKGLSQKERLLIGQSLFGVEGAKMALIDSAAFNKMAEKMLQQETLQKRLTRITETLGNRFDAAKGSLINLAATFGERLAPVLGPVLDKINSLLGKMQEWSEKHPKLTAGIIGTIGVLGTLAVVGGGSLWVFGKIITGVTEGVEALRLMKSLGGSAITFMMGKFRALALATSLNFSPLINSIYGFTGATWASTKALVAQAIAWACTPFGMIAIGVIALAGAGIYLYKNWDKVCGWFKTAWNWFQGLWAKVPGWAKWFMPFISIPMLVIQNWDKIKGFFSGLWGYISSFSKKFWDAGKNLVSAIWEGIKSMASKPVEAIQGIVKRMRNFLPFSPAKEGPLKDIHRIRLVETIAEGIKPGAILGKMGQLARVMVPSLALGFGGSAGHSIQINVTVQGGPAVTEDVKRAVLACVPEIEKALSRRSDSQQRRAY